MKTRIGVFFGGMSVEHEIAVISAVQAMAALDRGKYDVIPVYITKKGQLFTGEKLPDIEAFKNIPALLSACRQVTVVKEGKDAVLLDVKGGIGRRRPVAVMDLAFPIVHGTNCEDGSIAGFFELLGIPYVGCDVLSAALGMDKAVCKQVLAAAGIPVLPCVSFTAREWVEDRDALRARIGEEIGYPAIVKPANLGSSVGIVKVKTEEELFSGVEESLAYADKVLVERAVTSLREINCSVVGDADECEASVCEEPVMSDEILSYADKYLSGGGKSKGMSSLKRRIPAEIPPETEARITDYARRAFKALSCNGVVRIDFMLDGDNDNQVLVNEVNTIPGSLSFYLWEPKGVPYSALLDRLVELAFKRKRSRENLSFDFDTNILASGGALGAKGVKK